MDFPITDLLDEQQSQQWLEVHFHPDGLHCPRCQASREAAYPFRGVHKRYLAGYVAICELGINLKQLSPSWVARLVRPPSFAH